MSDWEPVRVQLRGGGDFVQLEEGAVVWSKLTIIRAAEGDEPEVSADVEVGADGIPECKEVRITTVGAGRAVRARDLRAVKLDGLLDTGYGMAALRSTPSPFRDGPRSDGELDWVSGTTARQSRAAFSAARNRKKRSVDDDLLREVAEVYRANLDRSPTRAVAERFGKAPSTAARYVQSARERGFLGAAINGKAGEQ